MTGSTKLAELLTAWRDVLGDAKVKAVEVLGRAAKRDDAGRRLNAALRCTDYGQRVVKFSSIGFARWLGEHVDVEHDGFALRRVKGTGTARYHVVDVAAEREYEAEMLEWLDRPIEPPEGFAETMEKRYSKNKLRTLEQATAGRKRGRPVKSQPDRLPDKNPEHDKVETESQRALQRINEVFDEAKSLLLVPAYALRFQHRPSAERHARAAAEAGADCDVIMHNAGFAIRLTRISLEDARAIAKKLHLGLHSIPKYPGRGDPLQPVVPTMTERERMLWSRGADAPQRMKPRKFDWDPRDDNLFSTNPRRGRR